MKKLPLILSFIVLLSCNDDDPDQKNYFLPIPALGLEAGDSEIKLSMSPFDYRYHYDYSTSRSTSPDSFEIFYSPDSTNLKSYKTVDAKTTELIVPSLARGTMYFFYIKSIKEGLSSSSSDTLSASPL